MSGLVIRNAFIIVTLSSIVSLTVNSLRSDGLQIIAQTEYEVFVPCPEPIKEVEPATNDIFRSKHSILFIDARPEASFVKAHVQESVNLPFDYLYPATESAVKNIAASGARHVVVYGDGGRPDPGHELARELAGRGIRNVTYVNGGFNEIKRILKKE